MKRFLLIALLAATGTGFVTASHAASSSVPPCPGHAPTLLSRGAPARGFVRPGAIAMRLCGYYGINWGDSHALRQKRLVRGDATISGITRSFNHLKKPPRGIFCARDDGSELLVVFGYPDGHAERIAVKLTGCRFAMNGRSTRWMTPRLQHRLVHLVKGR